MSEQPESGEEQREPEQAPPAEASEAQAAEAPEQASEPAAEAEEQPQGAAQEEPQAVEQTAPEPIAEVQGQPPAEQTEQPQTAEQAEQPQAAATEGQAAEHEEPEEGEEEPTPRVKPEVPGMHLEVDIVPEGADPFGRGEEVDPYATDPYAVEEEEEPAPEAVEEEDRPAPQPIAQVAIDLAAGARYIATGKRKTAVARVILKPGTGAYLVNGRPLDQHFPRATLQRNIRQPLEAVGYEERMDVVARLHGGGISAQAGALRHGVSKALIDADPNLRGELKRRGFLTRDARVKERKKAGLKKARKRPQFSKR